MLASTCIAKKCITIVFQVKDEEKDKLNEFFAINHYVSGAYESEDDFKRLHEELVRIGSPKANRLFYLALPPNVYVPVTSCIRHCCMAVEFVLHILS